MGTRKLGENSSAAFSLDQSRPLGVIKVRYFMSISIPNQTPFNISDNKLCLAKTFILLCQQKKSILVRD